MKEKYYGFGAWEYRYVCRSCGHAVKAPKQNDPCSRCGGDFGKRTSMRRAYLEPEKPPETQEVEYELGKTFFDAVREFIGLPVKRRVGIRREKIRAKRRWRWQTHGEVEEDSGVIRHDEFFV